MNVDVENKINEVLGGALEVAEANLLLDSCAANVAYLEAVENLKNKIEGIFYEHGEIVSGQSERYAKRSSLAVFI